MENLMTCEEEGSISIGTKAGPSSSKSGIQEQVTEGASVTIDMRGLESNWVTSIKERLRIWRGRSEASTDTISCSIHRVPRCLRQYDEKAYDPQLVSIGPLHYEKRKSQLQAMEEYKWRCLDGILSRSREGSLEMYLAAVKELEERARKCYSEVIPLDSNSFAEMMVLDACFMIELPLRYNNKDPIFSLGWLYDTLVADMMMLENQIPFFILYRIFDLIDDSRPHSIQEFAANLAPTGGAEKIRESNIQIQHLLHLMHASLILKVEEKCSGTSVFQRIPCASKLKDAGIKFKERTERANAVDILAIKFEKGLIEIPSIKFWDRANVILLNLIAFEQCYCPCRKYVTAYTTFMNCLISDSKDVEILCREGIIDNWVGSDRDMAALFNNMARELTVYEVDFYLSGICKEINQYCESTWPKLRATLVHDYLKNPWAIISFLAALLLLLLTITQTFFSSFPKFAYGK
ncbi:hypothetical protein AAC387_Pa07g1864 [Persea americana]